MKNCNDTLFGIMPEPTRSIGYRVWVKGENLESIADSTGLTVRTIECIAKDAAAHIFNRVECENEIAEPKNNYKVD